MKALPVARLQAELVQSRREGTFVYYATKPEMVSELVRLLTACC
jgi:hypothetical protein